jgi:hypothetical protein
MNSSNKDTVAARLKATVPRRRAGPSLMITGPTCRGVESSAAITLRSRELYDVKHKAACLLKSRLRGCAQGRNSRPAWGGDEVQIQANGVGVAGAAEPAVRRGS